MIIDAVRNENIIWVWLELLESQVRSWWSVLIEFWLLTDATSFDSYFILDCSSGNQGRTLILCRHPVFHVKNSSYCILMFIFYHIVNCEVICPFIGCDIVVGIVV